MKIDAHGDAPYRHQSQPHAIAVCILCILCIQQKDKIHAVPTQSGAFKDYMLTAGLRTTNLEIGDGYCQPSYLL